jgi:hypothetical protein
MAKPAAVTIPTEPIGSTPRPVDLIERIANRDSEDPGLNPLTIEAWSDRSAWQPNGVTWLP